MSAKRTVARFRDVVGVSGELTEKEANKRDPRFDSLCGNFDQKASYVSSVFAFINNCFFFSILSSLIDG